MFGLPESTEIRRQIPKTVLYEKFPTELSGNKKKDFENDISRIVVIHEISEASFNIKEGETVKAIFVVLIDLKNKDFNERNINLISKLFGQRILIVLHYKDEYRFVIHQTQMLSSDWFAEEEKMLQLEGLSLDNVWQKLVSQVSGIIPKDENTLDEQIVIENEKRKLEKQILLLEGQIRRESQSKKKYELHEQLLAYKKKLEEM